MTYKFKYRRIFSFFWKTFKVSGHLYDENQNKMILYFEDGGAREILLWNLCEVRLGQDWLISQQKAKEEQIGQAIPLKVKTK